MSESGLPRRRTKTPPGVALVEVSIAELAQLAAETKASNDVMVAAAETLDLLKAKLAIYERLSRSFADGLSDEKKAHAQTLRDSQRLHADLLSLLSIVQTVEHYLAPGEVRQVTAIEKRWVKGGES